MPFKQNQINQLDIIMLSKYIYVIKSYKYAITRHFDIFQTIS